MNSNSNLTLSAAGSMILGSGITQIATDLNVGLLLVGVGVALIVLVSVLNRYGFEVSSQPQG